MFDMVDKIVPSYCFVKDATYYFSRHVPIDLREHYSTSRIQLCMKTRSRHNAANAVKPINQKLDDYWMALRLSTMDDPTLRFHKDRAVKPSAAPLLSEAVGSTPSDELEEIIIPFFHRRCTSSLMCQEVPQHFEFQCLADKIVMMCGRKAHSPYQT